MDCIPKKSPCIASVDIVPPSKLVDTLNLGLFVTSVVVTVSNWHVEAPFSNFVESSEVFGSFFITGGTVTVHVRPDLNRWSVKIPHVSIHSRSYLKFPPQFEAFEHKIDDPDRGICFLYIKEFEMDGVDPVWNNIYDNEACIFVYIFC